MTRTVNLYAHDIPDAAWQTLVHDVEQAVAKARTASNGSGVGGSVYNSHGTPPSRNL